MSSGTRRRAIAFARRLRFYVIAAWSAVTLNFLIPRLMPGDPAQAVVQQLEVKNGQNLPPQTVEAIRKLLGGVHENIAVQYWHYLGNLFTGNLGISTGNFPTRVTTLIGTALPWTMLLMGVSTVLAFLIGTGIGALCGWRPGTRTDSVLSPLSTFLAAVPYFWVALFALWLFAFRLGWFPLAGGHDPDADPSSPRYWLSVLHYGLLPALTIVFSSCGGWLLGMRNMTLTTTGEDFVLLARAKGLSNTRVLFRYAARNAMLPQLTGFALALGAIIAGSVLTETVFTYPGVGSLLKQAIDNRDYPLMQGILLFTTLAVLVANFLADSVYVLVDPRTRAQGGDAS
ncbi:peptide ABC transporter permease [Mangrovactinospora gilvigrisea]|uniref:Peptide ABC transporter permease n=1 Tax=Mangrovactinospora gilvigrisea TaxID=1428644 RepID=A0A1J7BR18_9ACTN|nr:ABC transporter permease [Mangrovactinospora gilvigrisea]OIV35889.1 peptide ABC transporter permease [Mangrovactinospora gilvigrisea]